MNSVTSNGPDLYAQICHRIREAMGEFNDDNQSIESLIYALAENSREYAAHLAAQAEWPSDDVDAAWSEYRKRTPYDHANNFIPFEAGYRAALQSVRPPVGVVSDEDVHYAMDAYDKAWSSDGNHVDLMRAALESYTSRHAPTKD